MHWQKQFLNTKCNPLSNESCNLLYSVFSDSTVSKTENQIYSTEQFLWLFGAGINCCIKSTEKNYYSNCCKNVLIFVLRNMKNKITDQVHRSLLIFFYSISMAHRLIMFTVCRSDWWIIFQKNTSMWFFKVDGESCLDNQQPFLLLRLFPQPVNRKRLSLIRQETYSFSQTGLI